MDVSEAWLFCQWKNRLQPLALQGSGAVELGGCIWAVFFSKIAGLAVTLKTSTVNPIKLETGLRPNSAGIPYTLLFRIEAIGFPTFRLLLYTRMLVLLSRSLGWCSGNVRRLLGLHLMDCKLTAGSP